VLYTLVYRRLISRNVDPIEKKPLFHFAPGSRSFSIAAVGCNFRCDFCQNYEISQMPRDRKQIWGEDVGPAGRDAVGLEGAERKEHRLGSRRHPLPQLHPVDALELTGRGRLRPLRGGTSPGERQDCCRQRGREERTAGGHGWPDVVESVVYVTDMAAAPEALRVFAARSGGRLPVGTLVGTGLVSPEGRVEIMLTALK
jgi:pyruvate-formate lyase-activating enzyme